MKRVLFMTEAGENARLVESECKDFGTSKTACQLVKVEVGLSRRVESRQFWRSRTNREGLEGPELDEQSWRVCLEKWRG